MDFQEDTKNFMQSLTSTDPMQHSVYNHTLLSPHQVSISRAMPLHQCSRLVGGSPSAGNRVIDSLQEDALMMRSKDDTVNQKVKFNKGGDYLADLLSMPLSKATANTIHSTCTLTSKTKTTAEDAVTDGNEESGDKVEDDDDEHSDADDSDSSDDEDDSDVENFIQMHLERKKECNIKKTGGADQAVACKPSGQMNVTVQTMESFLRKTDELIKHNLLLQQQISTLKRETSLQTKVLTKLLVKRSKVKKKPYDENSASL